jgi:hypothetical protein
VRLDLAQETVAKEAGSAGAEIDAVVGRLRQAVRSGSRPISAFVNACRKPLALYLFTGSSAVEAEVLERTSSGSVCVNHLLYQCLVPELPLR